MLAIGLIIAPHLILRIGLTWELATQAAIFAMVCLSYNLLLRYTGVLSLGHGLFFGAGAYAVALFQLGLFELSTLLPLLFGVVVVMLLATGIGFLALRRPGVYFPLSTFAFGAMMFYLANRWPGLTGADNGLSGLHRHAVLGKSLDDPWFFYHVVATVVLVVSTLLWRLTHSPLVRYSWLFETTSNAPDTPDIP